MQPHHWAINTANTFRQYNGIDEEGPLVGEPTPISDFMLFDDGSVEGEKILGNYGLKLHNSSVQEVLAGKFEGVAVYITMEDDSRTFEP